MPTNNAAHTAEPAAIPADLDATLIAAMDATLPRYQRTLRHAVTRAEGENRLTMAQLRCLQAMDAAPECAYTTHLARQLQVAVPTMTNMLDGLVERDLVERHPDQSNRRQVRLVLTQAGRAILLRYETVMDERLSELLAHLTTAQKERLLAAMGDIAAMLDADERAAEGED